MEEIKHWKQQQGHERESVLGHLCHFTVTAYVMYASHSKNKILYVQKAEVFFPSYIPPECERITSATIRASSHT